jgi:DNA polymerase-3 subunit epsilon
MRQVVLDTETTGLSPQQGHRITEIGCYELINRQPTGSVFQTYLNPEREIDARATQITGLTWEKLQDEPKFIEVVDKFIDFIDNAELIIHNAQFDLSFLDHELKLASHAWQSIARNLSIIDTLDMARRLYPGQRNSLDALCKRYAIDNSHRKYHGALLDAEILAHVYLAMTAGQTDMELVPVVNAEFNRGSGSNQQRRSNGKGMPELPIVMASAEEEAAHAKMLDLMQNNK